MPARLKDLARVLREYGADVEEGGGKHNWRVSVPGKGIYTIPAHNGMKTEIPNEYVKVDYFYEVIP